MNNQEKNEGSRLKKICTALSIIIAVGMVIYLIASNIFDIDKDITSNILGICFFSEIILLNIPNIISTKK